MQGFMKSHTQLEDRVCHDKISNCWLSAFSHSDPRNSGLKDDGSGSSSIFLECMIVRVM